MSKVIRFPAYADLREGTLPMAKQLGVFQRIWRRLFANRRRANVAKLRLDRARRYG